MWIIFNYCNVGVNVPTPTDYRCLYIVNHASLFSFSTPIIINVCHTRTHLFVLINLYSSGWKLESASGTLQCKHGLSMFSRCLRNACNVAQIIGTHVSEWLTHEVIISIDDCCHHPLRLMLLTIQILQRETLTRFNSVTFSFRVRKFTQSFFYE